MFRCAGFPGARFLLASAPRRHTHTHVRFRLVGNCLDWSRRVDRDRPKDMPAAIRTISSMIKKARRMAAEFQTHVDEMVREADLGDVKKAFTDIRNLDIPSLVEKHVDPDRSIRNTFADNPFEPTYPTPQSRPAARSPPWRRSPSAPRPSWSALPTTRTGTGAEPDKPRRAGLHPARPGAAAGDPGRHATGRGARLHSPRSRAATPVQGVGNAPRIHVRTESRTWQNLKTTRSTTSRCRCSIT